MTALRQHQHPGLRRLAGNAIDLFQRAVFIVCALDRQHRAADARQFGFNVPVAEGGVQPDVVPAPEG